MSEILEVLRVEKKYAISMQEVYSLGNKLRSILTADGHNQGDCGYTVRSLYFDTFYDRDYSEKEDGLEQRRKVRLRTYGKQDSVVKLELKEKQGDFQKKRSLPIGKKDAEALISGNYSVLLNYEKELAEELYALMSINLYRPRCMVEYKRLAFLVQENDIRITLDTNLRASEVNFNLFSGDTSYYPIDIADKGILEVKYNRFLLSYIKDILVLSGRIQSSNSKYCMARRISKGI